MYENILKGAAAVKNPFDIIQVGANDGKYNDPIYEFVKRNQNYTNIILVEPQKELIPHLRENYSYHPSFKILNKAIGKKETELELYKIDSNYWHKINVDYGEGWPDYRIPTGVTTSNKDQLLEWVSKYVQTDQDPIDVINKYTVDVINPRIILESSNMNEVCLLQVDTEGMDDEIIYSFLDENIFPKIINMESKHLSSDDMNHCQGVLENSGYDVYEYTSSEMIALRSLVD
jgi:FkbM family methyltransferase